MHVCMYACMYVCMHACMHVCMYVCVCVCIQALCWGSSATGSILSAYASGSLVQQFGPSWVFALTAAFPLITAGVGTFIKEVPVVQASAPGEGAGTRGQGDAGGEEGGAGQGSLDGFANAKQQLSLLWTAFTAKSILLPVAFLVLWQVCICSNAAMPQHTHTHTHTHTFISINMYRFSTLAGHAHVGLGPLLL